MKHEKNTNIFQSIALLFAIFLAHIVFFIVILGFVFILNGFIKHTILYLFIGFVVLLFLGIAIWRFIYKKKQKISKTLNNLNEKDVEVSIMGNAFNIKISSQKYKTVSGNKELGQGETKELPEKSNVESKKDV